MTEQNWAGKTITVKGGKQYVLVKDRIEYFVNTYPNGCIKTHIDDDGTTVHARAEVYPDIVDKPALFYTGHSQERWSANGVNSTSAVENAETSAVGRALGMMGIGILDSIASADEVNKATNAQQSGAYTQPQQAQQPVTQSGFDRAKLMGEIGTLLAGNGITEQQLQEWCEYSKPLASVSDKQLNRARAILLSKIKGPRPQTQQSYGGHEDPYEYAYDANENWGDRQ